MEKFISFGKLNQQYKYILIYILIRIINDYLFSETFPKQIRPDILDSNNYPPNILVQTFFNYLGAFIFSIFFLVYENYKTKKTNDKKDRSISLKKYELIHYIYKPGIKLKTMLFIIFLSIISVEVVTVFIILGFMSLLYWVFDLYFLAYINFLIFGIPIYSHKKCAIIFIIIFSSVFKFLSTFEYIYNPDYNLFYKNHIFIIPIIIISYLLLSLTRFYSLCKIYLSL